MRRRHFIRLFGSAVVACPLAAGAQQQASKLPRIGVMLVEPSGLSETLSQGLREAGYVDGQNVILDWRYDHGSLQRIDGFARELVALNCSTIVAAGPYTIRAVFKETKTIPIVGIDLQIYRVANEFV